MELKYRGETEITQGKERCKIAVYSNELSLTEIEKKLFYLEMGRIITEFYKDPENQKKFEEWKKNLNDSLNVL